MVKVKVKNRVVLSPHLTVIRTKNIGFWENLWTHLKIVITRKR